MAHYFTRRFQKTNTFSIAAALLFLLCVQFTSAQNFYWGQQFGGPATLTGGTAVVGVNDNTSFFYNPGASSLIDSAKFTASSYIYGVEYKNLKNGAGKGIDLNSLDLSVVPQLISSSISFKRSKRLKLMYGTLTRFATDISFSRVYNGTSDVIPNSPGLEPYNVRLQYTYGGFEQWIGFGASYKVGKRWSFGFTTFLTYTHIGTRLIDDVSADAYINGLPYTTTANEDNSASINQLGLVFKIGIAARYEKVHIGLAVTPPGIKIYGQGSLNKSFEVYNLNQNANDTTMPVQKYPSYFIADAQGGLVTNYKQPFAIALGVKFLFKKTNIAFALEYFNGYRTTILKGVDQAVIRPTAAYGEVPVKDYMTLITDAKWVLNAGVGFEFKVKPKVTVLMGLRTDFNNRAEFLPNSSALGVLPVQSPAWHYLFYSAGLTFRTGRSDVTTGFDLGGGIPASNGQLVNLGEPQQNLYLRGVPGTGVKTYVIRANLILSWTYYIRSKY